MLKMLRHRSREKESKGWKEVCRIPTGLASQKVVSTSLNNEAHLAFVVLDNSLFLTLQRLRDGQTPLKANAVVILLFRPLQNRVGRILPFLDVHLAKKRCSLRLWRAAYGGGQRSATCGFTAIRDRHRWDRGEKTGEDRSRNLPSSLILYPFSPTVSTLLVKTCRGALRYLRRGLITQT